MAGVADFSGARTYLDANVLIYAIEAGREIRQEKARMLLRAVDDRALEAVTSELTLLECLIKPLRDGEGVLAARYRHLLSDRAGFHVVPITREILELAAEIRAHQNVRLPDAIHSATAIQTNCSIVATNDHGFPVPPGATLWPLA